MNSSSKLGLLFFMGIILNINRANIMTLIFQKEDNNMNNLIAIEIFVISYAIFSPIVPLLKYYHIKYNVCICLGYFILFFCNILLELLSNEIILSFIIFISAIGESIIIIMTLPYIKNISYLSSPNNYGTWIGIYMSSFPIGISIGYWFYIIVEYSYIKSIHRSIIETVLYFICIILCSKFKEKKFNKKIITNNDNDKNNLILNDHQEREEEEKLNIIESIKNLSNNAVFIFIALGYCVLICLSSIIYTLYPRYLILHYDISKIDYYLLFSFSTIIFGTIGSYSSGVIIDYLSQSIFKYNKNIIIDGDNNEINKFNGFTKNILLLFGEDMIIISDVKQKSEIKQLQYVKIIISIKFIILISIVQLSLLSMSCLISSFISFILILILSEFFICSLITPMYILLMMIVNKYETELSLGIMIFISHFSGSIICLSLYKLESNMLINDRFYMKFIFIWFFWIFYWIFMADTYIRYETIQNSSLKKVFMTFMFIFFIFYPFVMLIFIYNINLFSN